MLGGAVRRAMVALVLIVSTLAGACDEGPTDPDAAVADGAAPDAAVVDAAPMDADAQDAGAADGGGLDTGVPDAAPDAGPVLHHVVVQLLGGGAGEVTGGGFACDRTAAAVCVLEVPHGARLSLTARAAADSALSGWSVAGCDGDVCDVDVEDDLVLLVTFERRPVALTVETTGTGVVNLSPPDEDCTGACTRTYAHGSVVALTARPGADQRFASWTDACAGASDGVCVLTLTEDAQVGAAFAPLADGLTTVLAGTGEGVVRSDPAGIDCGSDCVHAFERGTPVTLTATATEGSDLESWAGDCAGAAPTCALVVDASRVAVATFRLRRYDLGAATLGDGTGRIDADVGGLSCGGTCRADYGHGAVVTLTASSDVSSTFTAWGGACAASGVSPTCALTMTAAADVTATFELRRFDLEVTTSGTGAGVVTSTAGIDCGSDCAETLGYGETVTLEAASSPSSTFVGWTGDCAPFGTAPVCTLDMTAARVVGAQFDLRQYSLTVNKSVTGGGAGEVISDPAGIDCGSSCEAIFSHGAVVTLAVTRAPGTRLVGWTLSRGSCAGAGPCEVTMDGDLAVTATLSGYDPTRLSETDHNSLVRLRPDDRLAVDFYNAGGVRSDHSIAPGSGVFYYEARRLTDEYGPYGFGVATSAVPIEDGILGMNDQTFGVHTDGGMSYDGAWVGGFPRDLNHHYGFVVDYRGATPTVHFIALDYGGASGVPVLIRSQPMPAVTTPLFIFLAGGKRVPGYEAEINPGNDVTNFPFFYDADAVLRGEGLSDVADALVLGWGQSYAGVEDAAPGLTLSADLVVTSGTPVTVSATSMDDEDGDLTASIRWELLSTPYYAGRLTGTGGSFSFTPTAVGLHPAQATVLDSLGQRTVSRVMVEVVGPVAQHDPVRLSPDALSGTGIELSPDGLGARWTGFGKMGIRANQSNYGEFWYFEIQRLIVPVNQGGGLVVGNGNMNPYDWQDVPPSCSINTGGGFWRNIVWQGNFLGSPADTDHYGFAVDYRGAHPIVYVIVQGVVQRELYLDDVWVEIYPVLYGNPTTMTGPGELDEAINFGAAPFSYDPVTALTAYGVDASALEVGWGDANTVP